MLRNVTEFCMKKKTWNSENAHTKKPSKHNCICYILISTNL